MPIYNYKALSKQGKSTAGVIEADTPRDARVKLRSQGLLPVELNVVRSEGRRILRAPRLFKSKAEAETATFTRQLATLVKSGIPLADGLRVLIEQVESPGLERAIMDIHERVLQGSSLADALKRHPNYFSDLYVNMVRSGEESGNLEMVLDRIAEYLQKRHRLTSKIQATMAYPIVVFFFGSAVVIFLLTFVVPRIANFLEQAHKSLPLPTWILTVVSRFLADYWYFFVIAALLLFFLFFFPEMSLKHKFSVDYVKILYSLKHFVYIIFKNKSPIRPLRWCGDWCGMNKGIKRDIFKNW